MNVTFTERAKEKLASRLQKDQEWNFKFLYDTEGCGCGVDGVFVLTAQRKPEEDDKEITSNYRKVWIEARNEVFFDEAMTVDYQPNVASFILKSNQQVLNPRMRFIMSE